jgi:hypothetical protein
VSRDPYAAPFALRSVDSPAPDVSRAAVVGAKRSQDGGSVVRAEAGNRSPVVRAVESSDSLYSDLAQSLEQAKRGVPLNKMRRDEAEEARRRERAYEPGRFERAVNLVIGKHVRRLGPGEYEVDGNEQPVYHVAPDGDLPCDCTDSRMRPNIICKHRLAAVLCELDLPLVQAFSDVIERRKKHAKEAGIETEDAA